MVSLVIMCPLMLTTRVSLLGAITGMGSQMFTLFAPGLRLLLSVCPRLREAVRGISAPLLARVSSEYLGFLTTLLIMMAVFVRLNVLEKYLRMFLSVLLAAPVITMFPLVVRLLVPIMTGLLILCMQVV